MAIRYKINVLSALKEKGFTTTRIRTEKIMGEGMLQKIRSGQMPSWAVFNQLCELLECQPADLIEFVSDGDDHETLL